MGGAERSASAPVIGAWAHPLSFVGDPAGTAVTIADAGFDEVRLGIAYHAARWLLTTSAPGAVAYLEGGGSCLPHRESRYGGTRLRPAHEPLDGGTTDAPLRAIEALADAGVACHGWVVALHNDQLAADHPQLAIENAFGRRYRHALCPAQPEVREYALGLIADAGDRPGLAGLDVEALGYLGHAHHGAHERIGVQLRPLDDYLLSLCLCDACSSRLADAGVDPAALRTTVQRLLASDLGVGEGGPLPDAAADALGADRYEVVQAVRERTVADLARAASAAAAVPVSLRVTADRHSFGGKTAGDVGSLADAAAGVTISTLVNDDVALGQDIAAVDRAGIDPARVTCSVSLLADHVDDRARLETLLAPAAALGIGRYAFYAFDLCAPERLRWAREALTALAPSDAAVAGEVR